MNSQIIPPKWFLFFPFFSLTASAAVIQCHFVSPCCHSHRQCLHCNFDSSFSGGNLLLPNHCNLQTGTTSLQSFDIINSVRDSVRFVNLPLPLSGLISIIEAKKRIASTHATRLMFYVSIFHNICQTAIARFPVLLFFLHVFLAERISCVRPIRFVLKWKNGRSESSTISTGCI